LVGGFDRFFVENTRLEEKAILLSEELTFFEGVGAVAFFGEAFFAKRVGGKESVSAGVPVGGVVVIGGMVHHGDDGGFPPRVGAVVADPAGTFSPGVLVGFPFGVGDVSFGDFSFVAEGGGDADGKGTFFCVSESDIGHGGESGSDIELEGVVTFLVQLIAAGFFQKRPSVVLPLEVHGERAFFGFGEGFVNDIGIVIFGVPEVVTVDIAVGEPERTVVGVIGLFSLDILFHGEITGEGVAGGSNEGVEIGEVVVGAVFGDESVAVEDFEGGLGFFLPEISKGTLNQKRGEKEKQKRAGFHLEMINAKRMKNKEGKLRE